MGEFHGNQHTENSYETYGYDDLVADVRSLARRFDETPTTRDAMKDDALPCLARIYDTAPGTWQELLHDAGLGDTQVEEYGPKEKPKMVRDLRRASKDSKGQELTTRDYDETGTYPTSVLKEYFGSWTEAWQAAGVESGTKHGTTCTGPQGGKLDSRLELAIAEGLDENQVEYVVHPPIPDAKWVGDFYLPNTGLWIEVDGYSDDDRPNSSAFEEKLEHYQKQGLDVEVVASPAELKRCLRGRGVTGP